MGVHLDARKIGSKPPFASFRLSMTFHTRQDLFILFTPLFSYAEANAQKSPEFRCLSLAAGILIEACLSKQEVARPPVMDSPLCPQIRFSQRSRARRHPLHPVARSSTDSWHFHSCDVLSLAGLGVGTHSLGIEDSPVLFFILKQTPSPLSFKITRPGLLQTSNPAKHLCSPHQSRGLLARL